jgi:hypothetical protein
LRSASPLCLATLLARGFLAAAPSKAARDCLARMDLDRPTSARARIEAALLIGALEASDA